MAQLELMDIVEEEYEALFVEVLLPLALEGTFTYRVPQDMMDETIIGKRVVVQFGKKKIYTALIVEIHDRAPTAYKAKYIIEVVDQKPIVNELQLKFWKWMANYYCCTLGEVMDVALPAGMKLQSESKIRLSKMADNHSYPLSEKEEIVLDELLAEKELSLKDLSITLGLKNIVHLLKSLYEKGLIDFVEEMEDSYKIKVETFIKHNFDTENRELVKDIFKKLEKSAARQADLMLTYFSLFQQGKPVTKRKLLKNSGVSGSVLKALVEKELLMEYEMQVDRVEDLSASGWEYKLDEEQEKALQEIKEVFIDKDVALLHGKTGSGKTHIYMELIDEFLLQDKQVLFLVPEIALTTQLISRLRNKYGTEIGIYHSKFNANERIEIFNKVLNQQYRIILGVRSALFLPFRNLGLIIIDEEHEQSYKQYDPAPRYHARDAAIYLMHLKGGKTLLGSATPSFDSYFNAIRHKYGLVKLEKRFGDVQLPEIILVDLRDELKKKLMKSHFSSVLFQDMKNALSQNRQIILFQNRRGYAPIIECTSCGWSPQCINCDISLTYHQIYKEVICHYCGYKEVSPGKCKACGNFTLKMLGFGTEKIEDELNLFFPENKSIRMDQDTTRGKQSFTRIIQEFEDNEAQIMIGTQMVTKGLDFENVQLVGILNADQLLRYPDFRAIERAYQMMSQVAGRAGRRKHRGKVLIQTYNIQHPMFSFLINHDYESFFNVFIQERIDFKYPPFYKLIKIVLKHEEVEVVKKAAEQFAGQLRELFGYRVLGPEFPLISRIRNKYIMQIMLKFERQGIKMQDVKKLIMKETEFFKMNKEHKKIRLNIDVDPY